MGTRHGDVFYADISGVARSYNYYPFAPMRPEDGVAIVALGLGKTVVDGGRALRFCPVYPHVLPQMSLGEDFINDSQRGFYAIRLTDTRVNLDLAHEGCLIYLDPAEAEKHGTLHLLGSVWSPDNEMFYDGIHQPGVRVVSFAHILKNEAFPLAALLRRLLEIGRAGLNTPVELEFAVNLATDPKELCVLQIRPCETCADQESVDLDGLRREELLCYSPHALGNGTIPGIRDIVYVKPDRFDPAQTPRMAAGIGALNDQLLEQNRPYLLIGPGRWGSSHRHLGIPADWAQVCAARVIVETTLDDFVVELSQGAHFFQNLTSFGIAYLTVNPHSDDGFIDWQWLAAQPVAQESEFLRHVRLQHPLEARLNGELSHAAILKHAAPPRGR